MKYIINLHNNLMHILKAGGLKKTIKSDHQAPMVVFSGYANLVC